ncbi:hypothetical protein G4O51_00580 [Candidatus Bathyarchaeota archaeon A05DMB-2]|nr:hypothetical protein [Candidatus Bathyarchaeota archaeon A05DMB-2]
MISWKYSFKRLNEEYEIAKKKKQALDSLYESGRISQATRDSFSSDINAAIAEIEKQQQALLEKMRNKTHEFEEQIKTLESILANYEIQHVIGEIDEEVYQREITLLTTGLESAKHELDIIKEAINQLCPRVAEAPSAPPIPEVPETKQEIAPAQTPPEETVVSTGVLTETAAENTSENLTTLDEVAVATEPITAEPETVIQEPAVIEEIAAVPEQPAVENVQNAEAAEPAEVAEATASTEIAEPTPEPAEIPITETPLAEEAEAAQPTDEIPQVVEKLQQAAENSPQIILENPQQTLENPAPTIIPEPTEPICDPAPVVEEIVEEQTQLFKEEATQTEETPQEAHPQKAPVEAQQEAIAEPIAENAQCGDEETSEESVGNQEQEV